MIAPACTESASASATTCEVFARWAEINPAYPPKRPRQKANRIWASRLRTRSFLMRSRSPIIKRSIVIGGRKTSVSLEDGFWHSLKEIALCQRITLSNLVAEIDHSRQQANLSSAIRLFVLDRLRRSAPNYLIAPVGPFDKQTVTRNNIQTRI